MAGKQGDEETAWIQTRGPTLGIYAVDDHGYKEFGLRVGDACNMQQIKNLFFDESSI